jgi:hypothetical protein
MLIMPPPKGRPDHMRKPARMFSSGVPSTTCNTAFTSTWGLMTLPSCLLHGRSMIAAGAASMWSPNPSYTEKLRTERPRDVTLEVALGDAPGSATLYEFGDTGLSTLVT